MEGLLREVHRKNLASGVFRAMNRAGATKLRAMPRCPLEADGLKHVFHAHVRSQLREIDVLPPAHSSFPLSSKSKCLWPGRSYVRFLLEGSAVRQSARQIARDTFSSRSLPAYSGSRSRRNVSTTIKASRRVRRPAIDRDALLYADEAPSRLMVSYPPR